jgi:signal transduction histidine kinase
MPEHTGTKTSLELREWQQFLDGAVHDLRAGLRAVRISAELLAGTCGGVPATRETIAMMLEGLGRIEALSLGLGSYSRALYTETQSAIVPVETVLQAAMEELQKPIRDAGAVVGHAKLPTVRGSYERLTTLFREILANALAYRSDADPRIEIVVSGDAGKWRFAVEDNGAGIEEEYWEKIFLPFQRLHSTPNGTGLGLTICKRIVEGLGGTMWVKSKPGTGSTFFFTLPGGEPGAASSVRADGREPAR